MPLGGGLALMEGVASGFVRRECSGVASMRAARYLAQADLRRRWRSVVVLTLLVGIAAGVVLTAVAGARRTASSFDRFVAQSRTSDVFISTDLEGLGVAAVERLPNVEAVAVFDPVAAVIDSPIYVPVAASVDGRFGRVMDRSRLLAGRRTPPGAVDEVALGESIAKVLEIGVGDSITLHTFTPEQLASPAAEEDMRGEGPTVRLRVVGIERTPADVGTSFEESATLVLPPGFLRVYGDRIGSFASLAFQARLAHGTADVPGFIRAVQRIYGRDHVQVMPVTFESAAVQDQLGVLSTGLLVFAAVVAIAGTVAIGQTLARQMFLGAARHPALLVIGMKRRERAAALLGPAAVVAVGGTLVAVAVAAAASPLMPIGVARRAEPDPGFSSDALVLVIGGVSLAVLVLVLAAVAAWRLTRQSSFADERAWSARPSVVGRRLARAGAGPAAVIGARSALEPGRGRTAVPVRATLIGATVGVVGVVAVLVFGASLDRLVGTPSRYGWGWDVVANTRISERDLRRDPAVAGLTEARFFNLEIGGHATDAVGVRQIEGSALPTVVDGRTPRRMDEVALGQQTLADLDVAIGDRVSASGPDGSGTLRVVGAAVFASVDDRAVLAEGAVLTERGLSQFIVNDDAGQGGYRVALVQFADGADVDAALSSDRPRFGRARR